MKLWEKCAIAKIAIKRGVQNTRNERMAEELKVKPSRLLEYTIYTHTHISEVVLYV